MAHLIFELGIATLTLTTQSVGHGPAVGVFTTWEPVRYAESQAPPPTYWIEVCILAKSPGDWYTYSLWDLLMQSSCLVLKMGKLRPRVFPGGSEGKESACSAGDPGLGRFPEKGNGHPLQYSCLENPMTEEPGGLQSIGLQRVGHDWAIFTNWDLESLVYGSLDGYLKPDSQAVLKLPSTPPHTTTSRRPFHLIG